MGLVCSLRYKEDLKNEIRNNDSPSVASQYSLLSPSEQQININKQERKNILYFINEFPSSFLEQLQFKNQIKDLLKQLNNTKFQELDEQSQLDLIKTCQLEEDFKVLAQNISGKFYELQVMKNQLLNDLKMPENSQNFLTIEIISASNLFPQNSNILHSCMSNRKLSHFVQISIEGYDCIKLLKTSKKKGESPVWQEILRYESSEVGEESKKDNMETLPNSAAIENSEFLNNKNFTQIPNFKLENKNNIIFTLASKTASQEIQYWGKGEIKVKDMLARQQEIQKSIKIKPVINYEDEYKHYKDVELQVNIQYINNLKSTIQKKQQIIESEQKNLYEQLKYNFPKKYIDSMNDSFHTDDSQYPYFNSQK